MRRKSSHRSMISCASFDFQFSVLFLIFWLTNDDFGWPIDPSVCTPICLIELGRYSANIITDTQFTSPSLSVPFPAFDFINYSCCVTFLLRQKEKRDEMK